MSEDSREIDVAESEELDLIDGYNFGELIHYIQTSLNQGWRIGEETSNELGQGHLLLSLENLKRGVQRYGINGGLDENISKQIEYLKSNYDPDDVPSKNDRIHLEEKLISWEERIRSHLERETRISISNPGLFDVERAMEHPEELFEPEVWAWLSDRTKDDIRQASRSLAVDAPTASVMVSLRAVENVLRTWYTQETGEELERGSWGSVLESILDKYGAKGPAVLTDLSYLKTRRNEVNHPERSPDWTEAEATLYRVRETINPIYNEIGVGE